MKNVLLFLFLLGCFQTSLQAQGWLETYYDMYALHFRTVSQKTTDQGHIIVGATDTFPGDLMVRKVDAFGQIQWTTIHSAPFHTRPVAVEQVPSDGSYVILYAEYPTLGFNFLRVSATGQVISDQAISNFTSHREYKVELTSDDELLIAGTYKDLTGMSSMSMELTKMDLQGNILWSQLYPHAATFAEVGEDIQQTTDGNYVFLGRQLTVVGPQQATGGDVKLLKLDTSGTVLWQQVYPVGVYQRVFDLLATQDGGCLVAGGRWLNSDGIPMVQKVDSLGVSEWTWVSSRTTGISSGGGVTDAVELPNGGFACTGYSDYNNKNIALIQLSSTGQALLEKGLSTGITAHRGQNIYNNAAGGYTIFGHDDEGCFLMSVDSTGALFSNKIVGHYYIDHNNNCLQDTGETAIPNQIIIAQDSSNNYYGTTDLNGAYEVEVDTGSYQVYTNFNSPYWSVCPDTQQVVFNNQHSRDTINFGLQASDSCLHLEVNISAPRLRRCFSSSYVVNYGNIGTQVAQNAYIEVTLDPYLTYDSSSIALTQQTGNTLRFDVGTLPTFYQNSFLIHVTVDCDSTALGQVHCTQAHIFPDTVCAPIIWTGAIINASSTCTNDSVTFRLYNSGAAMTNALDYTIIEEHVMIRQAPFQLGGGADTTITLPTTRGNYYRIEAPQEIGFPPEMGNPIAIADNRGCNGRPVLNNPTILGQFYQGNTSPFIAVDCQPNIGAYDPNDKRAQPQGYQANHYITNTTPLHYHIRFQNTGTDTAFTVVVVDTLDDPLDPATLQLGASSHPYTWELRENGILVVRFENIMLPDSNVNEPASNGFFKFKIQQDANNPDGTRIENRAGIYFDFNPPIITNTAFHTIGSNFMVVPSVNVNYLKGEPLEVKVYPNPFSQSATFEVVGGEEYQELELQLFNATGQLVQHYQTRASNSLIMERKNLPAGIYFYQLRGNQQPLSTGKVILK